MFVYVQGQMVYYGGQVAETSIYVEQTMGFELKDES